MGSLEGDSASPVGVRVGGLGAEPGELRQEGVEGDRQPRQETVVVPLMEEEGEGDMAHPPVKAAPTEGMAAGEEEVVVHQLVIRASATWA